MCLLCMRVFLGVCESSTLAKPSPWVQTRSIRSTWPSPLCAANQHWPIKSQARPSTCPLLTCAQTSPLDCHIGKCEHGGHSTFTNSWSSPQIPPLVWGTSSGRVQSCHARCGPPTLGPGSLRHCGIKDREYSEFMNSLDHVLKLSESLCIDFSFFFLNAHLIFCLTC